MADAPAERVLVSPGGRYDDQVDALLLFLEWFAQNERYLPANYLLPANYRSTGRVAAVGCPSVRRQVNAVLNRIRRGSPGTPGKPAPVAGAEGQFP
jgi:hypothetical protein